MGTLGQDLRYALRQLRKSPVFALTAIITLGLAIGVNAAMFSVIEQVLLRPLPYRNGARLIAVDEVNPSTGQTSSFSLPDLRDYQARSHSIQTLGFFTVQLPTLGSTENPQVVPQIVMSANFLDALGVRPMLGRGFEAQDGTSGQNHVLLLSYSAWQKFYRGDAKIVGRSVSINGIPYSVIGVLPAAFGFPMGASDEILSPIGLNEKDLQDRASGVLNAVALLRPGVSVAQAQAELNSIHRQLQHDYADENKHEVIRVTSYRDSITAHSRPALLALDWAVLAVWLIACANVAGLMLTRTNGRRREIAIRGALGADRQRITRQFLTESLLLSLAGGAAGLGIAALSLHLLRKFLANAVLFGADIHINAGVLLFLLVSSCVSALVFGLAPAWHAASIPAQEGLKEGSIAAGPSRRQALWRDGLVVTEITLTLALLIAAGLMLQTLLRLQHQDMGFSTENVVTGSVFLPSHVPWWNSLYDKEQGTNNIVQTFYQPLAEKLERIPGVQAVGFSTVRPLLPDFSFDDTLVIDGRPQAKHGDAGDAQVRATDAGFFRAMGIRLLDGRMFNEEDTPSTPVKLIVNRALVRQDFPNESPLGHRIEIGDDKASPRRWGVIVGVVENAKQKAPGEAALPEMDLDLDQIIPSDDFYAILVTFHMDVAVRGPIPLGVITDALRRGVHALQPEAAVQDIQPMQQVVDTALGGQTLAARLLGIFGLAALLIAVAGIYGLLAYSVGQRTRELGVRIALGAARSDILWLVLRHALILLAAGLGIGLAVAWGASGVMRAFLYGLSGYDAATVILIVLALGVCGLAASYLPARRAAAIDPVEALRTE